MHLVFTGPFVQRLGGHVDAIGPDDGADLLVNPDLGPLPTASQHRVATSLQAGMYGLASGFTRGRPQSL